MTERPCGGFFVAIGHDPTTTLFRGALGMDEQGYLKILDMVDDGPYRTTIEEQPAQGDAQRYFLDVEWGVR